MSTPPPPPPPDDDVADPVVGRATEAGGRVGNGRGAEAGSGGAGAGPGPPEIDPDLVGRAHQLLDYLEGLHRLRYPKPLDAIPDDIILTPSLPVHPAVRVRPSNGVLLEVDRIGPPGPISPPPMLAHRVEWPDLRRRPTLRSSTVPGPDPGRAVFDDWIEGEWSRWRDRAVPQMEARRLFAVLCDRRLTAERQLATHEVVWTHGIAVGAGRAGAVHDRAADDGTSVGDTARLPLFVEPVRYELDDRTGTIRVLSSGPTRLEIEPFEQLIDTFDLLKRIDDEVSTAPAVDDGTIDLLAEGPAADDQRSADDRRSIEDGSVELDDAGRSDVLERLSKVIADADYVPLSPSVPGRAEQWRIVDIQGLFHRRRPIRYEAYFRALEQALDEGYLPDTWSAILADEPTTAPVRGRIGSTGAPWASLDERILSPLPLNRQQRTVLTRLSTNPGVTVQGPPGTGKSYAIAAITAHLLTHGLRVLICAEKPHPLRVVREKMPAELQALCVAVLGDDRASTQQLESSIATITAEINGIDQDRVRRQLSELDDRLDEVRRDLAQLRQRELTIRLAEQRTVPVGDAAWSAAEAARHLASRPDADWMTDDVAPGASLPLSTDELAELIRLTHELPADDRIHHGAPLAEPDALLAGEQVAGGWHRLDATRAASDSVSDVVDLATAAQVGRHGLQRATNRIRGHRERLAWAAGPTWAGLHQSLTASDRQRQRWAELVARLDAEADAVVAQSLRLAGHEVDYPPDIDPDVLAGLRSRLERGRGLPRLGGGDLKQLASQLSVDGGPPLNATDLDLIDTARRRDDTRRRLHTLWSNELAPAGLPGLDADRPENHYQAHYQPALRVLLELPAEGLILSHELGDLFRRYQPFGTVADCDGALERLRSADAIHDLRELEAWLEALTATVAGAAEGGHPVSRRLLRALDDRDTAGWNDAADGTRRLRAARADLDRQAALVARLAGPAPDLAAAYRTGTPDHRADQVEAAWRCRQLRHWVDEILGLGDLAELSVRIGEAEGEEQRLLTDVVTKRAWLRMAERTTGAQRSALGTWAQAMARVGRGTGKHTARHRLAARRAMRSAQDAVPVWIMSIAQAIDSFRPGHDAAFDVVIVDEASQAPLDALAVLGLGQRVLVVGDDKQISPTTIIDETDADRLRRQLLRDVPDADGFDIRTSLYDTASRRFPGVIQLREHFRCLPEIIAFSNDLAYGGRIDPLREDHPDPTWVPVWAERVSEGRRDGQINRPEVERVVELVTEMLDDPAFGPTTDRPGGATIGVIAMVGRAQVDALQAHLIDQVPVDEIEARRIRVGSPYEFQGDERDVMIISMVDAGHRVDPGDGGDSGEGEPGDGPRTGRITGQIATSKLHQQRYNVAVSRARDRLVVVHSFEPAHLDERDLRRRLVTFAQRPTRIGGPTIDLRDRCESRFERHVLDRLLTLDDIRVEAKHAVAGYRIDFTLVDPDGKRVAIECDGDSFHGVDQLRADTERQRILERLGWRFVRIRASEYYADPDRVFAHLIERVRNHGLDVTATR